MYSSDIRIRDRDVPADEFALWRHACPKITSICLMCWVAAVGGAVIVLWYKNNPKLDQQAFMWGLFKWLAVGTRNTVICMHHSEEVLTNNVATCRTPGYLAEVFYRLTQSCVLEDLISQATYQNPELSLEHSACTPETARLAEAFPVLYREITQMVPLYVPFSAKNEAAHLHIESTYFKHPNFLRKISCKERVKLAHAILFVRNRFVEFMTRADPETALLASNTVAELGIAPNGQDNVVSCLLAIDQVLQRAGPLDAEETAGFINTLGAVPPADAILAYILDVPEYFIWHSAIAHPRSALVSLIETNSAYKRVGNAWIAYLMTHPKIFSVVKRYADM